MSSFIGHKWTREKEHNRWRCIKCLSYSHSKYPDKYESVLDPFLDEPIMTIDIDCKKYSCEELCCIKNMQEIHKS